MVRLIVWKQWGRTCYFLNLVVWTFKLLYLLPDWKGEKGITGYKCSWILIVPAAFLKHHEVGMESIGRPGLCYGLGYTTTLLFLTAPTSAGIRSCSHFLLPSTRYYHLKRATSQLPARFTSSLTTSLVSVLSHVTPKMQYYSFVSSILESRMFFQVKKWLNGTMLNSCDAFGVHNEFPLHWRNKS